MTSAYVVRVGPFMTGSEETGCRLYDLFHLPTGDVLLADPVKGQNASSVRSFGPAGSVPFATLKELLDMGGPGGVPLSSTLPIIARAQLPHPRSDTMTERTNPAPTNLFLAVLSTPSTSFQPSTILRYEHDFIQLAEE